MKIKQLLDCGFDEHSTGDAHSHLAWEGWLQASLSQLLNDYMLNENFDTREAFVKHVEGMCIDLWDLQQEKHSDEVLF